MITINMRQWAILVGRTFGHGWTEYASDDWPTCNSVEICNNARYTVDSLQVFQDAYNEDEAESIVPCYASAANNFSAPYHDLMTWETPSRFYGWCQPNYSHLEAKFTNPDYYLIVKTFPGAYRLIAPADDTLRRMVREKAPHGAIDPIVRYITGLDKLGLACANEDDKNRFAAEYRAWAGGAE